MIAFEESTWTIHIPPGETMLARQYDNLTRTVVVTGVPEGWAWTLLVESAGKLDAIDLAPMDGGVGVTLTAQMLALSGIYALQLRGAQGELVRHTNVIQTMVPSSLSGDATWPTVPTAMEQALEQLEELNTHPPYPGDGGYWMVWDLDSGAYVESQLPLPPVAEGPPGKDATITVGETITGEPGTPASVVNTGTESAAVLSFTIPQGQQGDPGAAATVAVGETVTGAPGTEASVENVGTSSAAVLRFTIPSGATGATPNISVEVTGLPGGSEPTVSVSGTPEAPVISLGIPAGQKGDPGDPGQTPNITIGTVETLPAGSSVTASITGQTPNLVLNLGIPQGQKGDPGEAATVTVGTTTTGAPGSQASVVNSGTESAAVLDFTIPAGETGVGLPPTDTAQTGDVPTWDGENVVWEPPAGGSGGPDFLADFTVEEAVAQYVVSTDIDPSDYSLFVVRIYNGPTDGANLTIASDGLAVKNIVIANSGNQIAFVYMDNSNTPEWTTHGAVKSVFGTGSTLSASGSTYWGGSYAFPQGLRLNATSELPAGMQCRIKGWK